MSKDFFWPGAPYVRHSQTSKAAARSLKPSVVEANRMSIMLALQLDPDGLTDDALQEITGIRESSERPRRLSLQEDNPPQIKDSGRRANTRSGHPATVWVVA